MTMNTYQETMRKLYDPENHEVLIASHRGKFSSFQAFGSLSSSRTMRMP